MSVSSGGHECAADFAESQVTTLVVDKKLLGKETAAVEYANVKLEDLVAIIHTSGTTGRPKAVMIRQESLVNALLYTNKRFEVIKTDNAFGVTNPSHDMSMYDIFWYGDLWSGCYCTTGEICQGSGSLD